MKKSLSIFVCLIVINCLAWAQTREASGTVSDNLDGTALPGVNIVVKGTAIGTTTDANGKFILAVPDGTTTLVISSVGYATQEVAVGVNLVIALVISSEELSEIVVSVGRGSDRTVVDSSVPIDIVSAKELTSTAQLTFDKALQYKVPSFNTVNTPVNDASTLLDPYELRNLGPSRTLILINGKRKNLSSLLYVQFAPGRGETGADLSGIPVEAIKRVEILRDGASAQYGSDAIAGVMNVILKDKFEYSSLNITSGVTSKGDGGNYGVSLNSGANFLKNGFLNYTIAFNQTDNAVRSGTIDLPTEIATFGDPSQSNTSAVNAPITNFLKINPTGGNVNGTGAHLIIMTSSSGTGLYTALPFQHRIQPVNWVRSLPKEIW